jgi:sporulation protein YunB
MPMLSVMILIAFISLLFLIDYRLKGSILEIARTQAELETVELINQAVNDNIVAHTNYQDIMYVHKDDKGNIVMLQANTVVLNQIIAKTINQVVDSTRKLQSNTISVALGQVTGTIFLAAWGPRINVRIVPTRQVTVDIENKFEQAGVNQTRHLIYLKINTNIKIAVPLVDKDLTVTTTVPLADTIIVGDVPQTYVNFSGPTEIISPSLPK